MRIWSLFILLCCLLAPTLRAAEPVLKFGVIPTESSFNLRKDYEPLRIGLEQALGMKVEMVFAPDYTSVIEAMRFNKVQLAHFGNNSAIDAVDRAQAEVFVQTVDKDGQLGYWSLIVVHRDSPVATLDELLAKRKDLTLAMGDHQSTSGTLVPGYYAFTLNGVNPAKDFKALRNANHEANILAVSTRQIDAATCSNEAMFRLEQLQPKLAAQVKIIWKGPLIASDPLVVRSDLPAELKARIAAFFTHYGKTAEERAAIAPLKLSGFRPSDNGQLLPYRLLRVLREKSALEADERVSAPDKAEKLRELSLRQAELERAIDAAKTEDAG